MSEASPPPPVSTDTAAPPRRSRRVWRVVRRTLLALVGLVLLTLVAARIYLSDERLTAWIRDELDARLTSEAALESFSLALLDGIEIRGLRLGPPAGFTHDVLRVGLLRVRWSLGALFGGRVVLPEVTLESSFAALEENERGSALDIVLGELLGPPGPEEPEPPPEPSAPFDPATFELPLPIELQTLRIEDVACVIEQPTLALALDRFGVAASFRGEGRALDLDLTVRLGDAAQPAQVRLRTGSVEAPDLAMSLAPAFAIGVKTAGLGDLKVSLDLDSPLQLAAPQALPPTRLGAELRAQADLITQNADVERLAVKVGQATTLEAVAAARGWLGATEAIAITLRRLDLDANLAELAPLAEPFVRGLQAQGRLTLHVDPLEATVGQFDDPAGLTPQLNLRLTEGVVRLGDLRASGLQIALDAAVKDGLAHADLDVQSAMLRAAGQALEGVALLLRADTPLRPWLLGSAAPTDEVDAQATLTLRHGQGEPWKADKTRVTLNARAPIQLVLAGTSRNAARAQVEVQVARAGAAMADARQVVLKVDAKAHDLAGRNAAADVALRVGAVALALAPEEAPLTFDGVTLAVRAAAKGPRYQVDHLAFDAGEHVHLTLSGAVADAAGPRPRLDMIKVALAPLELRPVLAMLPPSVRPPLEADGTVRLDLEADGEVPHVELAALFTPPAVEFSEDPETQRRGILEYVAYVERIADRFDAGLPCAAKVSFALENAALTHEAFAGRGLNLAVQTDLASDGPRITAQVAVEEVTHPEQIRGLVTDYAMGFRQRTVTLRSHTEVASYNRPDLFTRPIEESVSDIALTYKLGGDALLEQASVRIPGRPVEASLSGLIIKPVRVFQENGWQKAGLPGVEAELRFNVVAGNPEMESPVAGAPALVGQVGLGGRLGIRDGVLALSGNFNAKDLSVFMDSATADPLVRSIMRVDRLRGDLPFDVRVAFKEAPDATELRKVVLPFGGRHVGLLTADTDIRRRPARPVHFDRLRPYQKHQGLRLDRLAMGTRRESIEETSFAIDELEIFARLASGVLAADHLALRVWGGDIRGELAVQLSRANEVITQLALKFSNLDASNVLGLPPGPLTEISSDSEVRARFGPRVRDIELNMNVTKISTDALDRILQVLGGKEDSLKDVRGSLSLIEINGIAAWMRYESLNMNLDYRAIIPGLGPKDIRRHPLSDQLNLYLQPYLDLYLAPQLGWPVGGG